MTVEYLAYDIEVFKEDCIICFLDETGRKFRWVLGSSSLEALRNVVDHYTLVGFNNYGYDDYILTRILMGGDNASIKQLNDQIIAADRFKKFTIHPSIKSLDCMQQLGVGLKEIEANMGLPIETSEVDFDIDRKLTPEELEQTFRYCEYDVAVTLDVFKLRKKSYFEPKWWIVKNYNLPEKAMRYNATTITTMALGIKKLQDQLTIPKCVPPAVKELWEKATRKGNVKLTKHGLDYVFGFGGLHATNSDKQQVFYGVKNLDVASMYPNLIMQLNCLGESSAKFKRIIEERLEAKHTGDKVKANSLKLVINSLYGLLNNQYSVAYAPNQQLSVCYAGQAALYDLCSMLHDRGCYLIQANTDGVMFIDPDNVSDEVQAEWEAHHDLELELTLFDKVVQKDVNNYITTGPDGVKAKGKLFANLDDYDVLTAGCNHRIVDIACAGYLLDGKDPRKTICNYLSDLSVFQHITKKGAFEGIKDEDGNPLPKIVRSIATTRYGTSYVKWKNGKNGYSETKPSNLAPCNRLIGDLDVIDYPLDGEICYDIDIDFFEDLVWKSLKWYKGE